jgi:hypothetical protein
MEINNKAGEIKENLERLNAIDDSAQTAGAEVIDGATENLGKFKDVKSLLNAYNALQSEFTRRCQKVKELERENSQIKKEQSNNDSLFDGREWEKKAFLEIFPDAEEDLMSLYDTALYNDDSKGWLGRAYKEKWAKEYEDKINYFNSLEYVKSLVNSNEELKNQIIKDYLSDIENSKPTIKLISGNGMATVSPPSTPKNLVDAGNLARQIFEKSKENINL